MREYVDGVLVAETPDPIDPALTAIAAALPAATTVAKLRAVVDDLLAYMGATP